MNSAAKLRKRSVATLAASALLITGFGPSAFAWTTPSGNVDTAVGVGSIGLIDTAPSKDNTQGATVVTPGATNQPIGDVRFVVPSTFKKGDHIDFALTTGAEATQASRIAFSSLPAVDIDGTAYKAETHVADTSKSTGMAAGSTEGGTLTQWTPQAGSISKANAPQFTATLETVDTTGGNNPGAGAYHNVLRITFNNDSDAADAKFLGTIKGAKVDVGASVPTGDLGLTAEAYTGAGITTNVNNFFMGDTAGEERNVTYPAVIADTAMAVASGSVVNDGTYQYVGPVTVTRSAGTFTNNPVGFDVTGGTLDPNSKITAVQYDAAGKATEGTASLTNGNQSVSYTPTAGAVKVVFTGMALRAAGNSGELTYTLTGQGAGATGFAGSATPATRHQVDIERPQSQVASNTTATPLPDRIGGQDRYQTAVKIAERALGTDTKGPKGESDNVVIASGEGFADALSAGYLAATKNAQLILTRRDSLPQTDVEFLKTYGAKNVYIVGGTGSVSKAVEDQLRNMQSYDVQSATTSTSQQNSYTATYGTPVPGTFSLSNATFTGLPGQAVGGATNIVLTRDGSGVITGANVTGANASDWVWVAGVGNTNAAATFTYQGRAVTLTAPTAANAGTAATNNVTIPVTATTQTTTAPGSAGDAATAQGSDRKVVPLDAKLTVLRLEGSDRFATNRRVNEYAGATSVNPVGVTIPEYGKPAKKTAMVTNGMAPWDALAAGPLVGNAAGRNPIPVILTAGDTLNPNAKMQMQTLDIEAAMFIGGKGVLPDSLMGEADKLGAYTTRLAGEDRWGTAKAIADFAVASPVPSATNKMPGFGFAKHQPILANGGSMNGKPVAGAWADALAAGPFAAGVNGTAAGGPRRVLALSDSQSLPGTTKEMLQKNSASFTIPVLAVGLGDVLSTETVQEANAAIANK